MLDKEIEDERLLSHPRVREMIDVTTPSLEMQLSRLSFVHVSILQMSIVERNLKAPSHN